MKRLFLLLLISILVISFAGCTTTEVDNTSTVSHSVTEETTNPDVQVGSYLIFKADNAEEYLEFLTNFDESKYEITNISTFVRETAMTYSDDYYMITYKKIAD